MNKRQYLSDLLVGMLNDYSGRKTFRYTSVEIHSFFFEQKSEHPELLKDLTFLNTLNGKQSPELDQAFKDLKFMGVLGSWGSNFNPYEFTGTKRYSESAAKRVGRTEDLELLSRDFYDKFAVPL